MVWVGNSGRDHLHVSDGQALQRIQVQTPRLARSLRLSPKYILIPTPPLVFPQSIKYLYMYSIPLRLVPILEPKNVGPHNLRRF